MSLKEELVSLSETIHSKDYETVVEELKEVACKGEYSKKFYSYEISHIIDKLKEEGLDITVIENENLLYDIYLIEW